MSDVRPAYREEPSCRQACGESLLGQRWCRCGLARGVPRIPTVGNPLWPPGMSTQSWAPRDLGCRALPKELSLLGLHTQ